MDVVSAQQNAPFRATTLLHGNKDSEATGTIEIRTDLVIDQTIVPTVAQRIDQRDVNTHFVRGRLRIAPMTARIRESTRIGPEEATRIPTDRNHRMNGLLFAEPSTAKRCQFALRECNRLKTVNRDVQRRRFHRESLARDLHEAIRLANLSPFDRILAASR